MFFLSVSLRVLPWPSFFTLHFLLFTLNLFYLSVDSVDSVAKLFYSLLFTSYSSLLTC